MEDIVTLERVCIFRRDIEQFKEASVNKIR